MVKEMMVASGKIPLQWYMSDCNTCELLQPLKQKSSGLCTGHLETFGCCAEKAGRRDMEQGPQAAWCI